MKMFSVNLSGYSSVPSLHSILRNRPSSVDTKSFSNLFVVHRSVVHARASLAHETFQRIFQCNLTITATHQAGESDLNSKVTLLPGLRAHPGFFYHRKLFMTEQGRMY